MTPLNFFPPNLLCFAFSQSEVHTTQGNSTARCAKNGVPKSHRWTTSQSPEPKTGTERRLLGARVLFTVTPTCEVQVHGPSRRPAWGNSEACSCPPLRISQWYVRKKWGNMDESSPHSLQKKVLQRGNGVTNYYYIYGATSEAQTQTPAWLLKRECCPSPKQGPRSVPWELRKHEPPRLPLFSSRPSHWLPISWDALQGEYSFLSLLFWLSCHAAGALCSGTTASEPQHGLTMAKVSPASYQARWGRRQLSRNWTHRGRRGHNDQAEQTPPTHLSQRIPKSIAHL